MQCRQIVPIDRPNIMKAQRFPQGGLCRSRLCIEVIRNRADARRDRHLVVVQNDDKAFLQVSGVVEAFQCHSRRDGAIANDGNHVKILALQVARGGDAECR